MAFILTINFSLLNTLQINFQVNKADLAVDFEFLLDNALTVNNNDFTNDKLSI